MKAAGLLIAVLLIGCNKEPVEPQADPSVIQIQNGNVTLAAKLWLPTGDGKFPAVIVVEGSQSDPKESFEQYAAELNAAGIAVLTYDKRGNFESTGTGLSITVATSVVAFRLLASDVVAAAQYMKTHPKIDASRLGLFCSSQGVWIGAQAQTQESAIQYAINVVGSATSVGIENYYSQLSGNDVHGNNLSTKTIAEIDALVAQYNGPAGFDPLPYLKKINNPQLWVLGELDFGNPTRQSVTILEDLIADGKNIEIIVVPNANHDLVNAKTGAQTAVGSIIGSWLQDTLF